MTHDEQVQVAEAADNEGRPWSWHGGYPQAVLRVGDVALIANVFEDPDSPARYAEFMATFDPPTVLELLREAIMARRLAPRRSCLEGAKQTLEQVRDTLLNADDLEKAQLFLGVPVAERLALLDLALRQFDAALDGNEPPGLDDVSDPRA